MILLLTVETTAFQYFQMTRFQLHEHKKFSIDAADLLVSLASVDNNSSNDNGTFCAGKHIHFDPGLNSYGQL